MKITLTILFSLCLLSCCSPKAVEKETERNAVDTVFVTVQQIDTIVDTKTADSLAIQLRVARDSMKFYRDSISYENYINARRIAKVNYYLDCVKKNSNNKKFFYGWIKRTMSEK